MASQFTLQSASGQGGNPLGAIGAQNNNQIDLQGLLDMLSQGSQQANQANEQRFQQLLQGSDARRTQALENLNGLGRTEGRLIAEGGQQQIAASNQDLTSRGLSGSTIRQGNINQINTNTRNSQTLLQERVSAQKLGTLDRISQDRQGFIERREDLGPDASAFSGLLQQLGLNQANDNSGLLSRIQQASQASVGRGGVTQLSNPTAFRALQSEALLRGAFGVN